MSIESDIVNILRTDPVGRISFKIDNIAVNKTQMEGVAKAIESQDIKIEVRSTGELAAGYSSFTGRRVPPGEKKLIGKLTLSSADFVKSRSGKAGIFHECVHALMDVKALKVTMHNDEVIAYVADAIYLRATNTAITGNGPEMAIYNAAFALVDGRKMLTKPGATLTWKDCDSLRDAIKAHTAYRG